MSNKIPVASPALIGNEKKYVLDCIDSSWISSNGKYIDLFERAFAEYLGIKHAISCCNGTVALHAALLGLGVKPGDEVIVPSLTYVATANAVTYCGAKPVFVDSEKETWNLDPSKIKEKISEKTRGIIAVHLYGHPANMGAIKQIAVKHNLFILEDAAEAHGALYEGVKVGTIGDASAFSFYGNKILSTGEGGMICTEDDNLASIIRQIKGQGQDPKRRFWFPIVGYNYRMTNIEAALGLAQLEKIEWHTSRRREVAMWYKEMLAELSEVQFSPEMNWAKSAYWMSSVILDNRFNRDEVMNQMQLQDVETRPFFYPMHTMPIYQAIAGENDFPIAEYLGRQGINLPSSALLTKDQVAYVVRTLKQSLIKNQR